MSRILTAFVTSIALSCGGGGSNGGGSTEPQQLEIETPELCHGWGRVEYEYRGATEQGSGWIDAGTSLVLEAKPDAYSTFGGWSGDCSGSSPTCTLRMDRPRTVKASFLPAAVGRFGRTIGGSGSARAVAVGSQGELAVVGAHGGGVDLGFGSSANAAAFAAVYEPDGTPRWIREIDTQAEFHATAIVGSELVAVGHITAPLSIGSFSLNPTADAVLVARFDSATGEVTSATATGTIADGRVDGAAVASSGDFAVFGAIQAGPADLGGGPLALISSDTNHFVARFSPDGTHVWSRLVSNSTNDFGLGFIAINSTGAVALTGSIGSTLVLDNGNPLTGGDPAWPFAAYWDGSGDLRWQKAFAPGGSYSGSPGGIALEASGDVYFSAAVATPIDLGGGSIGPADNVSLVVARFAPDGSHLWSTSPGAARSDALVTSGDAIFVAGSFSGETSSQYAFTPLADPMLMSGGSDLYVLGLAAESGAVAFAQRFGCDGQDQADALAAGTDRVCFAGSFSTLLDFGAAEPLQSSDDEGFFACIAH